MLEFPSDMLDFPSDMLEFPSDMLEFPSDMLEFIMIRRDPAGPARSGAHRDVRRTRRRAYLICWNFQHDIKSIFRGDDLLAVLARWEISMAMALHPCLGRAPLFTTTQPTHNNTTHQPAHTLTQYIDTTQRSTHHACKWLRPGMPARLASVLTRRCIAKVPHPMMWKKL